MKQSKYGVIIDKGADEPRWLGRSAVGSSVTAVGEAALGDFNKSDTQSNSIVYIPANGSYGNHGVETPIFMSIANGGYGTGGKSGFVHLIFGGDVLDGNNYAAALIQRKEFKTALSDSEKKNSPSAEDGYLFEKDSYANVVFPNLSKKTFIQPKNDRYIYKILDSLFSGKQVFVNADSQAEVELAIQFSLMWLPACYANEISFNTCATTARAAEQSMICGVRRLDGSNLARVKSGEAVLINKNECRDYTPQSAYCKLLDLDESQYFDKDDERVDLLEATYSKYAAGDKSLARLNEAAKAAYLYYLRFEKSESDTATVDEAAALFGSLPNSVIEAVDAAAYKLNPSEQIKIKDEMLEYFALASAEYLFSTSFFELNASTVDLFKREGVYGKIDADAVSVIDARSIVARKSAEEHLRYFRLLTDVLAVNRGLSVQAYAALSKLFLTYTPAVGEAARQIAGQIKKQQFTEIWTRAQSDAEFQDAYSRGYADTHLKTIRDCVGIIFTSEADKRDLYDKSAGDSWLFKQAYTAINSLSDADEWLDAFRKKEQAEVCEYCAKKFEQFAKENRPERENYTHYRSLFEAFGCTDDVVKRAINSCAAAEKERSLSAAIYAKRRKFLQELYEFQKANGFKCANVPDEYINKRANSLRDAGTGIDYGKEIEDCVKYINPKKKHSKRGSAAQSEASFSILYGLITLLVCALIPCAIALGLFMSGLPLDTFLEGLPRLWSTVVRLLIYGVPIAAALITGALCYLSSSDSLSGGKNAVKSIVRTVLFVDLPYLAFCTAAVLLYYVIV